MGLISLSTWLGAAFLVPLLRWASGLVSLALQQQWVLLSPLSGLCFSGSVRRQKVLGKLKGLSWRVFPHSEEWGKTFPTVLESLGESVLETVLESLSTTQVATRKGLRILYSKPVTLVLGQGFKDLEQQRGL